MIKVGSLIPHRQNTESKENNTFERFLGSKKIINNITNQFKRNLIDALTFKPLNSYYDEFIGDTSIFPKNIETFYHYIIKSSNHISYNLNSKKTKSIPGGETEWFGSPNAILKFINGKITDIAHTFLSDSKEYHVLSSSSFYTHVKSNYPDLLGFISFEEISIIYTKLYKQFLKELGKNEYGLDQQKANKHLHHILNKNIGDGSFLYEWSTAINNGINKYQRGAVNPLYVPIKQKEDDLYEYIFKQEESHIKIVKKVLNECKSLVELGTGGIAKLEKALLYSFGTYDIQKFLKERKTIILTDVNSNGFMSIRHDLNKIIGNDVVEGTEVDIRNSNSNIYTTQKPIYFMFGGTIGNFTNDEMIILLQNMKPKHTLDNSYFIFTYFHSPDKNILSSEKYSEEINKIKAMYGDDESNPFFNEEARNSKMDFVLSGFQAIGLDRLNLKYHVEYEDASSDQPARIKLGAQFINNQTITVDEYRYNMQSGDIIWALQSSRFTKNEISNIAKSNGYDLKIQQDNDGVSIAMLQSKIALNDKYKKARNIGYGIAIAATLVGGCTGYHTYEKNKIVNEKIQKHESDFFSGVGMHTGQHIIALSKTSEELTSRFIKLYGSGSLSKEEIKEEIRLYLEKFSNGQYRFSEIYGNLNPYNSDAFLDDFINRYFYKKMFKNGFENLNTLPILSSFEDELVATLEYAGPLQEGYNEKTGTYFMIHNSIAINNKNVSTEMNRDLVSGYILEHTGKINTITIPDLYIHKLQAAGIEDVITLSESKVDKNGCITVKRFVFDGNNGDLIKRMKEGKKIIFLNSHTETQIGEHKNLTVDKQEVIKMFEKGENAFNVCRNGFLKIPQMIHIELDNNTALELKRLMIIDLYSGKRVGHDLMDNLNPNWQLIGWFIGDFYRNHKNMIQNK